MNRLFEQLREAIGWRFARKPALQPVANLRVRPGQHLDAQMYAYGTGPNARPTLATYAYSAWVQIAVNRLASSAAKAGIDVVDAKDPMKVYPDHPLMLMIGKNGTPNDYQDSFEFWENHYTTLDLAGNSFWFWYGDGGLPIEVHQLEPELMRVVPGVRLGIDHYIYTVQGREFKLYPEEVTHFKRPNPYNRYWGLSALQALMLDILSDRSMVEWNNQFFGDDVAVPAGIVVVPSEVTDAQLETMADEFNARHAGRRRTAFIRSPVGGTVYHPAGVVPKDMDFTEGRLLSRRAVYEALELPLGLMSEASTEAHARVAERQLAESIHTRHTRTARKLNADALPFWPAAKLRLVQFEDLSLRSADWDRESKRLAAVKPFMLRNEVRTQILHLPAIPGWDEEDKKNGASADIGRAQDRRDTRPVQSEGQAGDMVES